MQAYDFIVLALLVVMAVWGARRGLVKQLASLLSIVLGYIVAVNFRHEVAPLIEAPHPWNSFAAMLALFMGTSLLVWIAFRFVNGRIEKAGLTAFDTQMGGLFGAAKGLLLAGVLTMFAVVMLSDAQRHAVLDSYSGNKICRGIFYAQQFVPSEWQDTVRPYLETVQQAHEHTQGDSSLNSSDDPFALSSPSDSAPFSDALELGPSFDTFEQQLQNATEKNPPQYPQATLQTPIFDR